MSKPLAIVLGKDNGKLHYIQIAHAARGASSHPRHSLKSSDQTLTRIEAALSRLEQGTFGFCTNCGDEICLRRLHRDPATRRCQDCASGPPAA